MTDKFCQTTEWGKCVVIPTQLVSGNKSCAARIASYVSPNTCASNARHAKYHLDVI